jgi:microcystin-dependent protein
MADTVTPKLGLVKPEIGGSADSWGNKLNGNFDKIDLKMIQSTDQWSVVLGDGNPTSTAGHFIITRYNNSAIPVDDPFWINRQTGDVNILKALNVGVINSPAIKLGYQPGAPVAPPAGSAHLFFDAQGNLMVQRPDGVVQYVGVPPGTIGFTGAATADIGWALLNGQLVSRVDNPVLFSRYGVRFHAGDGSTTFGLPNAMGRVLAHADVGGGILPGYTLGIAGGLWYSILTEAQLPAHRHYAAIYDPSHVHEYYRGVAGGAKPAGSGTTPFASDSPVGTDARTTGVRVWDGGTFDYTGSIGGNAAHSNVQPTLALNAQVKLG